MPVALFFLTFVVYLYTLCPTIYWRDAPEFVTIAFTLGIGHPAGFPTYALLGKAATFLPVGEIPFRLNLVSAVFSSLAVVMIYYVIRHLLRLFSSETATVSFSFPAAIAALLFGFSYSLWHHLSETKSYNLLALLLIVILFCLLVWFRSQDIRYLFLGAFLYGLSAGIHVIAIFFLPGFMCYVLLFPKRLLSFSLVFHLFFFAVLGLSTYLYLPIRSSTNPTFDWGNPETLKQFLVHVTDRKDAVFHFAMQKDLLTAIGTYVSLAASELTLAGLLCGGIGWVYLSIKNKPLFLLLSLTFLANVSFFIGYWKNGSAFIPSFLILSLCGGVGMHCLLCAEGKMFFKRVNLRRVVIFLSIVFLIFSLVTHYHHVDKANYANAYTTARAHYSHLPPYSVLLTELLWYPFRYLQDVERWRDDVTIITISDILRPEYFNMLTHDRFPHLLLPSLLPEGEVWLSYLRQLIALNLRRFPVYVEPDDRFNEYLYPYLEPEGFLLRATTERQDVLSQQVVDDYQKRLQQVMETEINRLSFFEDPNSPEYYSHFLVSIADYLALKSRTIEAIQLLNLALTLKPDDQSIFVRLGYYHMVTGHSEKAEELLLKAITTDPRDKYGHIHLGFLYLNQKKPEKAARLFQTALELDKDDADAHHGMGLYYEKVKKYTNAQREVETALEHARKEKDREKFLSDLIRIKKEVAGTHE